MRVYKVNYANSFHLIVARSCSEVIAAIVERGKGEGGILSIEDIGAAIIAGAGAV